MESHRVVTVASRRGSGPLSSSEWRDSNGDRTDLGAPPDVSDHDFRCFRRRRSSPFFSPPSNVSTEELVTTPTVLGSNKSDG
jgi:hypothetical protein